METENDHIHRHHLHDKQFSRTKVKAIVRNAELSMVKELVNNIVNEFNVFIHSNECIGKNRWEKTIDCHMRIATYVSDELLLYFDNDMCTVLPTGDPFTVSVQITWY